MYVWVGDVTRLGSASWRPDLKLVGSWLRLNPFLALVLSNNHYILRTSRNFE